ncbi:DUF1120 domain-containing protein [Pseudomonas sp. 18175]|uniref:DUF1120 domain-containing protein n=1 Tax=Pseudomonas sp. 18175 TaxID=3390056 RepID=UPI003D225424
MSITRNLLVTALLTSAGHAVAASSIDMSIRGSITPSACELSLANGGVFDLGKVAAKDLQAEQPTNLEELNTQLAVTCEAATLMGIEFKDNRAGSSFFDQDNTFGLGLINGNQKLGHIGATLTSYMADGTRAFGIHSMDGGLTWAAGGGAKPGSLSSVYTAAPMAPVPVQVMTAKMILDASIAPAKGLTLTDEVPIDGSITMTVRYL